MAGFGDSQSLIPPELQQVIDQVSNMTNSSGGLMSPGRRAEALTSLTGIGAGLLENQNKIASAEKLGMMGMQNDIERQKIASTPNLMESQRKNRVPGLGMMGGSDTNDPTSSPSNWYTNDTFSNWWKTVGGV